MRNSDEVEEGLTPFRGVKCVVFTSDIKDLYYSPPRAEVFCRLTMLLELDLVGFHSRSGIFVEECLVMVYLYLQPTVVDGECGRGKGTVYWVRCCSDFI